MNGFSKYIVGLPTPPDHQPDETELVELEEDLCRPGGVPSHAASLEVIPAQLGGSHSNSNNLKGDKLRI